MSNPSEILREALARFEQATTMVESVTAARELAEAARRALEGRPSLEPSEEPLHELARIFNTKPGDWVSLLNMAKRTARMLALGHPSGAQAGAVQRPAGEDRADAERYRWMRDVGSPTWLRFRDQWQRSAAECDAAIDREMARQVGARVLPNLPS